MERWNTQQHSRMKVSTLSIRSRGNEIHQQDLSDFRRNIMPTSVSLTLIRHMEPSLRTTSGILRCQASLGMDSGNGMLKRMPIVMPMDIIRRGIIVIMFMFLSLVTFNCFAEGVAPSVKICDVLKNIDEFDGRLIELHTDIRITMHGRYLIGAECGELGSIGLVINDEEYKNTRIKK